MGGVRLLSEGCRRLEWGDPDRHRRMLPETRRALTAFKAVRSGVVVGEQRDAFDAVGAGRPLRGGGQATDNFSAPPPGGNLRSAQSGVRRSLQLGVHGGRLRGLPQSLRQDDDDEVARRIDEE